MIIILSIVGVIGLFFGLLYWQACKFDLTNKKIKEHIKNGDIKPYDEGEYLSGIDPYNIGDNPGNVFIYKQEKRSNGTERL